MNQCSLPVAAGEMLENVDIVDLSIAAVGVAMLPLLPDLLANLMVVFLPDAWATDELVKLTPEDLRDLLVNFDELNATLAPWPCLRAMLGSAAPERFAPCAETELPSPREVAALRVPSMSASAAVVLPCDGGRRAAKLPRHVKADPDALCARAAAMGRALHGSPRAEVCVLP